jgi:serine/threonine-protein kinase
MRLGRYELTLRLATGGMAEVFLARQVGLGGFEKTVAVKRILPHLASSPEVVQMFLDEAQLAARLDHPHITHIYDFGSAGGLPYLAMELVPGEDLAEIARMAAQRGLPVPPSALATLLIAACDALHYAHEMRGPTGQPLGIVHRDISPSNVLVRYDGGVKIADFGIARAETRANRTHTGVLKGKYAYMSPEQARGEPVDRRADIWSLGVCGWELLAGRRLFARDSEPAITNAVLTARVPSPGTFRPDAPPGLADVILRALARDPAARWQTAQTMQLALEEYLSGAGTMPSKITLARYMRHLFGAERAAERERLVGGVVPARPTTDVLATPGRAAPPEPGPEPAPLAPPAGAMRARPSPRAPALSKRTRVLLAALLTGAAAGVSWLAHPRPVEPPRAVGPMTGRRVDASPRRALAGAEGTILRVESEPPGAQISIDGAPCGEAPVAIAPVAPGRHLLRAERPGFEPHTETVEVGAGQQLRVRVTLALAHPRRPS